MDEMKIKISTSFMRGIVAKVLTKVITKKLGIKPYINLNGISIEKNGDNYHVHLDIDADINEKDLLTITRLENMEEL